jgi:hypothetical protein
VSVIDPRTSDDLMQGLLTRLPAFVPEWQPAPGGAGDALLWVYAEFLHALSERIAQAPDKNEMAFLDMLGLDVLPAQGARAAVVFTTLPGAGDGQAPAGTRLNAKGSDPSQPLSFETERAVALTQARVAEVVSLWPGRDAYADHSADALGGRPFTLWTGLQPVPHELYLAHDLHFALSGVSSVGIDLELAPGGSEELELEWSWWDGQRWCAFKQFQQDDESGWSLDATSGLTRSGRVRLATDCAASVQRVVGGWNAHWLRARTTVPLPPDATRTLGQIDRITLKTVLDRRLPEGSCDAGLSPDTAFAGGQQLDTSKAFFPLGKAPGPDIAFYVACADAFSRPNAQVEFCFELDTAQKELDDEIAQFGEDATAAVKHVIDAAKQQSLAVQKIADAIIGMAPPNDGGATTAGGFRDALKTATDALTDMSGLDGVATAAKQLADSLSNVSITLPDLQITAVDEAASKAEIQAAAGHAQDAVNSAASDIGSWGEMVALISAAAIGGAAGLALAGGFDLFEKSQNAAKTVVNAAKVIEDLGDSALGGPTGPIAKLAGEGNPFSFGGEAGDIINAIDLSTVGLVYKQDAIADILGLGQGRSTAKQRDVEAAKAGDQALIELAKLSPLEAAAAAGKTPPDLGKPVLVWEYWDGGGWTQLVSDAGDDPTNLRASGRISFDVPHDWGQSKVNGTDGLWLRARIVSGVFGKLTLVSWKDEEHEVHYLPIIEPRPPQLDAFHIGYYWESKPSAPQHTLSYNDFAWEDHTGDATWRGDTFPPFRPVADTVPALYVGFDGALPADELGLLADVEEVVGEDQGPALVWESFDGASWNGLSVEDETSGLAVPGIVHIPYPGDEWPAPAPFTAAAGQEITLRDARSAALFTAGNQVWVASESGGELALVGGAQGATVSTQAPLTGTYQNGTVARAALPRFGTPRSWMRARLRSDGDPRQSTLDGLYGNATWTSQVETVSGEVLGSSSGEPSQAFFLNRTPVLAGEVIDVRELEGGRAHVEYPLLVAELAAVGISESDLVVELDAQTGAETAVWVPWQSRPNLGFSGPGDRHYTIERTHGRVEFGDGVHGLVPVVARDNIRARQYQSSQAGTAGNVPAGAITQVTSGLLVSGVTNPRAAEGGAASESDDLVLARGPLTVRNRRQAVTAGDYEALAFEASPAVAVARAATARGTVTVTVVPQSPDPQPEPSWELRREVEEFLRPRMPAAAGSLSIVPPKYFEVGVSAVVVPRVVDQGGVVVAATRAALAQFLHPLTGGPGGNGWPFGRSVYLSDVAALVEGLEGVDHAAELSLLVAGAPAGEVVAVPADRLVAAGFLDVTLGGTS